jgi:hypothetical protein
LDLVRDELTYALADLARAEDKIDALTRALTELYLVTVQPPCEPWVKIEFMQRHNRAMITARLLLPEVVR